MKERPILFKGEMVQAILEGRKTQTRRIVKPQPEEGTDCPYHIGIGKDRKPRICPYGTVGDWLWVRETFSLELQVNGEFGTNFTDGRPIKTDEFGDVMVPHYRASDEYPELVCYNDNCKQCDNDGGGPHWKPSIHMPRWASRINLEITSIHVERLQKITRGAAISEGCVEYTADGGWFGPEVAYCQLWEKINGAGSWEKNPWVWVIEFKRLFT